MVTDANKDQKYYKLAVDSRYNVIGRFPQTETIWNHNVPFDSPKSYKNAKINGKFQQDSLFPELILKSPGKITDLITEAGFDYEFLIVSERLLNSLIKLNIDDYQVFSTYLHHKKSKTPYFIIHFSTDRRSIFFDWKKCDFELFLSDESSTIINGIDENEFLNLKRQKKYCWLKKGVLKNDQFFDIFKTSLIETGILINNNAKSILEKENFTGLTFTELHWL
jgi:hypothetical protein